MDDYFGEEGRLVLPHGLWFIGPKDCPRDPIFLCETLMKAVSSEGALVAAFTDEDLAQRFLERIPDPDKAILEPFHPKDPEALAVMLTVLAALGQTHLAIDPERKGDFRTSIQTLIDWCEKHP
jgi:hypothetical protein